MDENSYIEVTYIIKTAVERLGLVLEKLPEVQLPLQPLLINVASMTIKGCSSYYKILRKKNNLKAILAEREEKWHGELNTIFGISFWNQTYSFTASIKFDNRLKWMQYQIVRNSQFTNIRVNKFKPNVSPLCSYCKQELEKISHLYFHCPFVLAFWVEIQSWLNSFSVNFPLSVNCILFGYKKESYDSKINYTILTAKSYIW